MKCPRCNKDISTFFRYYLWSHPFATKCNACKKEIKPDATIKKTIYLEVVISIVIGIIINLLMDLFSISGFITYSISLAIIIYPFEKYSWNNGRYSIRD